MIQYILDNKEWLIPGIGAILILFAIAVFKRIVFQRRKRRFAKGGPQESQQQDHK